MLRFQQGPRQVAGGMGRSADENWEFQRSWPKVKVIPLVGDCAPELVLTNRFPFHIARQQLDKRFELSEVSDAAVVQCRQGTSCEDFNDRLPFRQHLNL